MLKIGIIAYSGVDQIDITGPFEVFSRLPDATVHILAKELGPVRDMHGFLLTPEMTLAEAPPLDVLQVPGGYGQEALMDDEPILSFIRKHAESGRYLFSVCTGALICGAAGILRNRRATTNWTVFDLLPNFGAIPVHERVVVDGALVTAAGATAGIDGALTLAALLCGKQVAQEIQLEIEYAPEPPFESGTPESAPAAVLQAVLVKSRQMKDARTATARRFGLALL